MKYQIRCHLIIVVCIAIVALTSGILFYALFRTDGTPFGSFSWWLCSLIFSDHIMTSFRQWGNQNVPGIVINSYPNFIWCFSWVLLTCAIWEGRDNTLEKYLWILCIPICCALWELSQYHGIVGGVGSIRDVASGIIATLLGWLAFKVTKTIFMKSEI